MVKTPKSGNRRARYGRHEPKGVKKRQHSQHAVLRNKRVYLTHLTHITDEIAVAEHDSFRLPGASTAEDHGGQIIRLFPVASETFQKTASRPKPGSKKGL